MSQPPSTPAPQPGRIARASAGQSGWMRWLPGLTMLRDYRIAWLRHDVAAGLVLTTMLVPVGIAYAVASGVPGIYGLYATIVPLLAYALFARTFPMISPRLAEITLGRELHHVEFEVFDHEDHDEDYVHQADLDRKPKH